VSTSTSSSTPKTRTEYLERLRDLLPPKEAPRILADVEGLLLDRMEAAEKDQGLAPPDAERRAVQALGSPEALADQLVSSPLQLDRTTRRAFVLWFAVVLAGHLLLSIVLTAAGGAGAGIPGLLGPLDRSSIPALLSGLLAIVLMDAGAVLLCFVFLGRGRVPSGLPRLGLSPAWSRRDSALALVLLSLVAVLLLEPVRDAILAVRYAGRTHPLVSPDAAALVPWAYAVLGLHAVRHLMIFARRGEGAAAVATDAVASLATVALLVLVSTRDLARLPEGMGRETAAVLADLLARVFLVVLVGSAFLLSVRAVKRILRLRDLLAAA
jgi:hypothetical protein